MSMVCDTCRMNRPMAGVHQRAAASALQWRRYTHIYIYIYTYRAHSSPAGEEKAWHEQRDRTSLRNRPWASHGGRSRIRSHDPSSAVQGSRSPWIVRGRVMPKVFLARCVERHCSPCRSFLLLGTSLELGGWLGVRVGRWAAGWQEGDRQVAGLRSAKGGCGGNRV